MNKDELIDIYKKKALVEFKSLFDKRLSCGRIEECEILIKRTLFNLGLEQFENEEELLISMRDWYQKMVNIDFISSELEREDVNEVIIHTPQKVQLICNELKEYRDLKIASSDLKTAFQVLALKGEVEWNFSDPFASFTITIKNHLHRVTLIHGGITSTGIPKAFFRKVRAKIFPLNNYGRSKDISIIKKLIEAKKNIVIAGSTGSGKTSLLSSMLREIDTNEHIVVLEDTSEIQVERHHATKLLSKNQKGKELQDYMSYAMRMSPDRLILGEMRSKEIVPFVLAMNTGHRGLMATIHANSACDTIDRIGMLFSIYGENNDIHFKTVKELVIKSIDIIIYVENKEIKEIVQPIGIDGENPIYREIYNLDESDFCSYH